MWLFEDRSRRRGRCRAVWISGEDGSFLTTILGAWGPRSLEEGLRLDMEAFIGGDMEAEKDEEVEGRRREEVEEEGEVEAEEELAVEERGWDARDIRKW